MKTKFYYLAIAMYASLCAFTSCATEEEQQIRRYKDCFYDYVETDFDDVSTFDEITDVVIKDTMKPQTILDMYESLRELGIYDLLSRSKKQRMDEITDALEQEIGMVGFDVKVRLNIGKRKQLKVYHGLENLKSGEIKISPNKIDAEDKVIPESYRKALLFMEEIKP